MSLPPPKKCNPRVTKSNPPTKEELKEFKKRNPGKMHPYWIQHFAHYHAGDKSFVAKADQ